MFSGYFNFICNKVFLFSKNVFECRYYLVPLSIAQKSKWKKKGTKLHIFNDHTFIAKHLPGYVYSSKEFNKFYCLFTFLIDVKTEINVTIK